MKSNEILWKTLCVRIKEIEFVSNALENYANKLVWIFCTRNDTRVPLISSKLIRVKYSTNFSYTRQKTMFLCSAENVGLFWTTVREITKHIHIIIFAYERRNRSAA